MAEIILHIKRKKKQKRWYPASLTCHYITGALRVVSLSVTRFLFLFSEPRFYWPPSILLSGSSIVYLAVSLLLDISVISSFSTL